MKLGIGVVAAVTAALTASAAFAQGSSGTPEAAPREQSSPDAPRAGVGVDTEGAVLVPVPGAKATTSNPDTTSGSTTTWPPAQDQQLIWRGSTLIFDQSVSSETIGVGRTYQTYKPSYQIWMSFRPQVHLYHDDVQDLSVQGRADYYKTLTNGEELSNGGDATTYREDVFGDIWLTLLYKRTLFKQDGWQTGLNIGPRALLPTSKASQGSGTIMTVGAVAGINETIPLNRRSDWLREAHIGYSALYTHPFVKDTTAASTSESHYAQGVDARTFQDFQLSGKYLTQNGLLHVLSTGLQITPKLGFGADAIFIQRWRFGPSDAACGGAAIPIQTGGVACAQPGIGVGVPTRYVVQTWLVASLDYQVLEALNMAVGYYNFANQLGEDGTRRTPFFAPESSRFFLTATLGLDSIYDRLRGRASDEAVKEQQRITKASPMAVSF